MTITENRRADTEAHDPLSNPSQPKFFGIEKLFLLGTIRNYAEKSHGYLRLRKSAINIEIPEEDMLEISMVFKPDMYLELGVADKQVALFNTVVARRVTQILRLRKNRDHPGLKTYRTALAAKCNFLIEHDLHQQEFLDAVSPNEIFWVNETGLIDEIGTLVYGGKPHVEEFNFLDSRITIKQSIALEHRTITVSHLLNEWRARFASEKFTSVFPVGKLVPSLWDTIWTKR